jgi:hypothetical protein
MWAEKFIFIVAASLFLTAERVQIYLIFKQKIDEILAANRIHKFFLAFKADGLSFFAEDIVEENLAFRPEKSRLSSKVLKRFHLNSKGETQRCIDRCRKGRKCSLFGCCCPPQTPNWRCS